MHEDRISVMVVKGKGRPVRLLMPLSVPMYKIGLRMFSRDGKTLSLGGTGNADDQKTPCDVGSSCADFPHHTVNARHNLLTLP